MRLNRFITAALLGTVFAGPAFADALVDGFQNPPNSARPRVWWHWMNGNITIDGIDKDMAWMKRIGIGGLQNFDAGLETPQIVDKRLVYMTPEWKAAFKHAASKADALGLELAIAASPGWSETGGPWVKPENGLKKLVWSETPVAGGTRFVGKLAAPPAVTGPYQNMGMQPGIEELLGAKSDNKPAPPTHYGDVGVIAVPVKAKSLPVPTVAANDGAAMDASALFDDDLGTVLSFPRTANGPGILTLSFASPQTVRSATVLVPGFGIMFLGKLVDAALEATSDGKSWRKIASVPVVATPTTVSFPPVKARQFRLVLTPLPPSMANMGAPADGTEVPPFFGGGNAPSPWRVAQFILSNEARIDQAETKAGFNLTHDYYALPKIADGAVGADPAKTIDLTSRMSADGTLDWTPPKGRWRILRFGYSLLGTTNHPAPPEATGLEVDKFDGDAVRAYLEHYIGMYKDAAGADMIGKKGVQAILTDSIEVGAANWTPKMIAQFLKRRGYDPAPWLPTLTGVLVGTRAQSDKFLYDFRRTLADLMASEHYGVVAEVARKHDLKVYGEALEDHRPSLGDDMSMRAHADVPMAALWTYAREQGPRASYVADMKGAASVAHLYGQNLVAAESMTSAVQPWAYAPRDLRRIIDTEFVSGVNRPVVHTSVHQPRDDKFPGLSLMIFGQYFNRHEAWAELAKPWVDYLSRTAFLLQQGRHVADVAYFYGEEAPLTALYGDTPVADAPKTSAYDFLSADALLELLRTDGSDVVAPSGARYKLIYLGGSSRMMSLTVLKKLASLVEGGATVAGAAPIGNPGLGGNQKEWATLVAKLWPGSGDARVGKGRVITAPSAQAALDRIGVAADFRADGSDQLSFLHRQMADGDSWFLVNRANSTAKFDAHFRVAGKKPMLWHADTGTMEAVSYRMANGETIVPLSLAAEDSVFVIFREATEVAAVDVTRPTAKPLGDISGPWSVSFQSGRGAPAATQMAKLVPLEQSADPGIRYFSGMATYSTAFVLPANARPGAPLWLDLGTVADIAEVRVNGQLAGYSWFAPDRVDIGAYVKPGKNMLDIRVANKWINRLIGDKQPGAAKITFTAAPTYKADAPLRPSGLIGPVTLSGE